jgi:hypothetical protein
MSNAIENIQKKIDAMIENAHKDKRIAEIAQETADQIRNRTRLGKDGDNKPLAPLKDRTIKQRARQALDPTTNPKKSNLTRTGQMLRAITSKVAPFMIIIFVDPGSRDDGHTNQEVAGYAMDGSANRPKREFFKLAPFELNAVKRKLKEFFLTKIREAIK